MARRHGRIRLRLSSHLSPQLELLAREQCRSANPGPGPVASEADLSARPDALDDEPLRGLAGRAQQQLAGGRDAAADDDEVGVERVDRVRDADAERLAEDAHRLERVAVAGPRGGAPAAPVADAAREAEPVERTAGGVVLERGGVGEAGGPPRA